MQGRKYDAASRNVNENVDENLQAFRIELTIENWAFGTSLIDK